MYDVDHQKLYIGVLLADPDLFVRVRSVTKTKFFSPELKRVVKEILDYNDEFNGLPDPEYLYSKTKVEIKVPSKIDDAIRAWFIKEYPKFCLHKALSLAVVESSEMLESESYEEIEVAIKDALQTRLVSDYGLDYDGDPKERLRNILERSGNITTGYKALDHIIGKLNMGDLVIFAGGSGTGKSLFLQNAAIKYYLENHMNVLYISLELHPELCARRIDAMTLNTGTNALYNNLEATHLAIKNATKGPREEGKFFKLKYMPSGSSTGELKAFVKDMMVNLGQKPDVIVVDYLDLMTPIRKVPLGDVFEKDKAVSEELRNMMQEFEILSITASQLNRASVGQEDLDHSHIAGGISKINTADLVLGIIITDAMREKGHYELQILKVRNSSGTGRRVKLDYNPVSMRMTDNQDFLNNLNSYMKSSNPGKTSVSETEKLLNEVQNTINQDDPSYDPVDVETGAVVPKELRTGMGSDKLRKLQAFTNEDDLYE